MPPAAKTRRKREIVIDIISAYLHTLCVPARPKESTERKLVPAQQSAELVALSTPRWQLEVYSFACGAQMALRAPP